VSSRLLHVTLHPAPLPLRYSARVTDLPECSAFARSMRHLHGAISEAILGQLTEHEPVRLIWQAPVEEWSRLMWASIPVGVVVETVAPIS